LFHDIIVSILDVYYAFICYFISFFGTNLLTQCPVPVAVFCLFLVFQEISTKLSPNAMKLFDDFFLDKRDPGSFGRRPEDRNMSHKPPGHAQGEGRTLVACGPTLHPFALIPTP
jgi:hypothetical protein